MKQFFCLGVGVFCAISCFPMGLPEYFAGDHRQGAAEAPSAGLEPKSAEDQSPVEPYCRSKPLIIVVPDLPPADGERTLGTQFLLGVIPFTRLYLEHGAESQLLETVIEAAQANSCMPLIVQESSLHAARALFDSTIVVRPRVQNLSINAYDLIFSRLMSVSAEITLGCCSDHGNGENGLPPWCGEKVSAQKKITYALGPQLAAFLRESLAGAADRVLKQAINHAASGTEPEAACMSGAGSSKPVVVVELPSFAEPLPPALGAVIAGSYGFRKFPAYGQESVRRIIQRGLERGLANHRLAAIFLVSPEIEYPASARVMRLASRVDLFLVPGKIEQGGLQLAIEFSLIGHSEEQGSVVRRGRYQIEEKAGMHEDGYWVKALEKAAAQLVDSFVRENLIDNMGAAAVGDLYAQPASGE